MILTWLKIMYYKITKPAVRSVRSADPGTGPHAPVHATEACAGPTSGGLDTSKCSGPEELRCYACLSVHATEDPCGLDPSSDAVRTPEPGDYITEDRFRELVERGIVSVPDGDGDTYRLPQGLVPGSRLAELYLARRSSVRPSDEIEYCGRCQHPWHGGNGAPCGAQVASRMQDGGFRPCPCTGFVTVDDTDEAVDGAWNSFLGLPPEGTQP